MLVVREEADEALEVDELRGTGGGPMRPGVLARTLGAGLEMREMEVNFSRA